MGNGGAGPQRTLGEDPGIEDLCFNPEIRFANTVAIVLILRRFRLPPLLVGEPVERHVEPGDGP